MSSSLGGASACRKSFVWYSRREEGEVRVTGVLALKLLVELELSDDDDDDDDVLIDADTVDTGRLEEAE